MRNKRAVWLAPVVLALVMAAGVAPGRTITVGPSNPQWPSPQVACDSISTYDYDEDLILEIEAGTYTGQCNLTRDQGSRVITFRPVTGAAVTITSAEQYTWTNTGTNNVKVEGLTIITTNSAIVGAAVFLQNVSGCRFSDCVITSSPSVTHLGFRGVVIQGGADDSLIGCQITTRGTATGTCGVQLIGTAHPVVMGCTLDNSINPGTGSAIVAGIRTSTTNGGLFEGNTVNAPFNRGIRVDNMAIGGARVRIIGNVIRNSAGATNSGAGINFAAGNAAHFVANNYITDWAGTTTTGGIHIAVAANCSIIHNTFVAKNASGVSCIYLSGAANNAVIRNNIFKLQHTGSQVYYQSSATFQEPVWASHNNISLATGGTNVARVVNDYFDLAGWQARGSGYANDNTGVVLGDPMLGSSGYHLTAGSPCIGAGEGVASVPLDIDGELRNAATPDIGCDEFEPAPPAPVITDLTRTPQHPIGGEVISITARIWVEDDEIETAEIQYSNDQVSWTDAPADSVTPEDSTYFFHVPGQEGGNTLYYRLYAATAAESEYTTPVQSVYIPFTYAIAEIQECDTLVSEVTPKLGEYVHTRGIVTGFLEPRKFFVADAAGPWDAIYIYNAQLTVTVGDSVDVVGTVEEYQGLTQVAGVARFDVNGSNRAVETTKVTFDEARLEAYENVLVRLDSVRIVNAGGNFGSNVAYQCATFDYADTMVLYSTAQSAFVGTPIPDGAFTLVCNIGDYNGRQLIPRYPGDITPIADLATVAILAPGAEMEPGETVTPTAVFRNNDTGTTAQNVRVSFHIGGFYQIDRFITELGPGAEDTIEFNQWTAIVGVHPVRAFVSFPADPDRSNDTVSMTLTVAGVIPEPGQWVEVAPIPAQAGNRRDVPHRGAWLAVGPDQHGVPAIYATKGNKLQNFYRYDVPADTWVELAPVPLDPVRGRPLRQGARGASDGDNSIFAVHGNNTLAFWHYDIAANEWRSLRDVPEGPSRKRVRGGGDMVHVKYREEQGGPPVEYIYFLKGDRDEFWRYHIESGTWQQRQSPPPGIRPRWQRDSWLAARVPPPGHGHGQKPVIYAHKARYFDRASGTHDFYRYHVAEDSWETQGLAGMPLIGLHNGRLRNRRARDGGAGDHDGGFIYAIKGGNSQQFWMYDVAGNEWTESDTMPTFSPTTGRARRVNAGADLVRYDGGRFFALKGNRTQEFWRYVVPTGLAQAPRPERSGVMAGVVPAGAPFVKLGPNPLVGGFATLRLQGDRVTEWSGGQVSVYDVSGRSVFSVRIPDRLATGSLSLDMRSLSAGVYLVKVEAGDYTASQKLVVQK